MHGERGFTYMLLLFFVAIIGVGLAITGDVWHTTVAREKEKELLFDGDAFRQAIASYYLGSPGVLKQYPAKVEDLLKDPRFPDTRRYLRTIYPDPVTGKYDWILVKAPQGGIMGVYSPSGGAPFKRTGFSGQDIAFNELALRLKKKLSYSDWNFVYDPALANFGLFRGFL